MSWTDPCSNCGEDRADCNCGNWNGYNDPQNKKRGVIAIPIGFSDPPETIGEEFAKLLTQEQAT